jgi:hypothetical protein
MKRLLFIAVAWGAALLPMAAQAQSRGMGFRGPVAPPRVNSGFGARPSGFAPRPTGFTPRPAGFAPRPLPMNRLGPTVSPARITFPQSRVFISTHNRFFPRHRRFHRFAGNPFFFSHSCFNGFFDPFCRNRFFFGSGFIDPSFIGLYDPFFSGFDYPAVQQQQPVVVEQDNSRERELALKVQELSDEIELMRDEQRARETRSQAETKPAPRDDGPNTLLVLRDGRELSVRNYAIVGDSIWVLDEHRAQRIPLSRLDVTATEQANAKNGVEIHLFK